MFVYFCRNLPITQPPVPTTQEPIGWKLLGIVSTLILPLTRIITDTLNSPTEIPGVTTETIMMCKESLEIIKQTPKVTRELIPED